MTGARWKWNDSGSSSGRMQRVADSGTYNRVQAAYRAYIGHSTACADCEHGEIRCPTAAELWAVYQAARS